jgi:hypothetical protein
LSHFVANIADGVGFATVPTHIYCAVDNLRFNSFHSMEEMVKNRILDQPFMIGAGN